MTKMKKTSEYVKKYEDWFLVPTFGPEVKKLEGKRVQIKGYIIPVDLEGTVYALSAYPFSACYFCGAAGPESVMTLLFAGKPPKKYEVDEVATFEGTLTLNVSDPEEFIYVLTGVSQVK